MKRLCGMAVVAITLVCAPGSMVCAQVFSGVTGNEVLRRCNATLHAVDTNALASATYEAGYCLGMVQAMSITQMIGREGTPLLYCTTNQTTYIQSIRVIVKYLKDNPHLLHTDGIILAVSALQKAFPCKR